MGHAAAGGAAGVAPVAVVGRRGGPVQPAFGGIYTGLALGTAVWALEAAWTAAASAGLRQRSKRYARARAVISGLQAALALALVWDAGLQWARTQLVIPPGLVAGASAAVAMLYGRRFLDV